MSGPASVPTSLHTRRFAALNQKLVRLVAIASTIAAIPLGLAAVFSGDTDYAVQALGGGAVAVAAWAQIAMGRNQAAALLAWATAVIVITTSVIGSSSRAGASSAALAIIGMVSSLFLDRGVRIFVTVYGGLLVAANFSWYQDFSAAAAGALISASAFTFGVLVLSWLRVQLQDEASRFHRLFARAPVSIWEEDFTEVGDWLAELRSEGIVDLLDYLDNHPEALAHAAGLIRVNAVNDAAVELLEADS